MDIWLSTIGQRLDNADNTRTFLLARYLMDRGHRVTLWTSAYDHIRKEWRQEWTQAGDADHVVLDSGLIVRFMKGCGYTRNISLKRFWDHILAARDFQVQAARLDPPDIVVASLPDHFTAAAVVTYARTHSIPSIIDVRDKWPDIFVDYAPAALKPLAKVFLVRESGRVRTALRHATALVAMMHSMLDWAAAKASRRLTSDDQVFFLSTMESTDPASAPISDLSAEHQVLLDRVDGKTVLIFVGTFNKTQHPLLVIEAVERLVAEPEFDASSIALLVGGDGQDAEEVWTRVAALDCAHKLGWLKPPEMRALLVRSDVGLLPMNFASPAFNNKAFAYLACGLPIINCALGDLEDLIAEHGIGINIAAGDAEAVAKAIRTLVEAPETVDAMKAKVRVLYAERFDPDRIYNAYVDHVEHVASRR